ncbi:MAG: hypothetical protein ACR2M1_11980 [Gemmatimonadaceae bacterium]
MRKLALIALAPLLAPLCLTSAGAQTRSRVDRAPSPIAVRLLPPLAESREPVRYVVSEPAYVAVFVVIPGSGVRLLYPDVDQNRLQSAGYHFESLATSHVDNDIYHVVLGPTLGGPRYLYIVASRYPIDVERFVHRPARLASTIGYRAARSFDADVAIDALLDHVVSLGGADSWDADVYMLWADRPGAFTDQLWTFRNIRCANGLVLQVPEFYPFAGCPGDERVRLLERQAVQQQALASARDVRQQPDNSKIPPPTVLPTIIGVRRPTGTAGTGSGSVPYPATITAAGPVATLTNGSEWAESPGTAAAPAVVEVPVEVPVFLGNRRGEYRALRQDEPYNGGHRWNGRDGRNGPGLAPTPRLAPTPGEAPEPRIGPSSPAHSSPAEGFFRPIERGPVTRPAGETPPAPVIERATPKEAPPAKVQ